MVEEFRKLLTDAHNASSPLKEIYGKYQASMRLGTSETDIRKLMEDLVREISMASSSLPITEQDKNLYHYLIRNTIFGGELLRRKSSSHAGGSSSSASSSDDDEKMVCLKPVNPADMKVSFKQIAGQDSVKRDIMKNYIFPISYPNLFVTKSNSMLFYGPPGTGKTLLAKATVKELGLSGGVLTAFFSPTPGDIKGSKHGQTEKNIDFLFKCAGEIIGKTSEYTSGIYSSSVIFIDEFDGIGGLKKDDAMMTLSVNSLLQKMDGMTKMEGVSVIAATNYPWNIEEALLRRFTARVFVDLPDTKARKFLLLEPLYKHFTYGMQDKPELIDHKNKLNYDFLTYLQTFGKYGCRYENDQYTAITKSYISELATKLGPNEKAIEIVEKIKDTSQEFYDPDDNEDELKIAQFGYSGSDISKVMDIAIQKAAFRAFKHGTFIKVEIAKDGGGKEQIFVYKPDEITVSSESKGIFTSSKTISKQKISEEIYTIHPNKAKDGFRLIEQKDYKKIRNFTICFEDIEEAISEYPSTIRSHNYVNLLNYKYRNVDIRN